MVFIEDGNPDNVGNLINWRKCKFVANIVKLVQSFQTTPYDLSPPNPLELDFFLENLPKITDRELYAASLKCEPRGALRSDIE